MAISDTTLQYEERTTPSGVPVEIRSRTWPEWEQHETYRIERIKKLKDASRAGTLDEVEDEAFGAINTLRNMMLECRIKNFAQVKAMLTLRDIAFIEHEAEALEKYEVPLGNSASGDAGP